MFSKDFGVYEDTFARCFEGLLNDGFHKKGKNVNWLEVVVVAYLSSHLQSCFMF